MFRLGLLRPVLVTVSVALSVTAQDVTAQDVTAQDVTAQEVTTPEGVKAQEAGPVSQQYSLSISRGGIGRFVPDQWGLVSLEVVNQSDRAGETFPVCWFGRDSGLQFSRKIWLPAHSKRRTWCPVRPPKSDRSIDQDELRYIVINRSEGVETLQRKDTEQVIESRPVSIETERLVTGIMSDATAREEPSRIAITAARQASDYSVRLVRFNDPVLPPIPEALEGLDQLVISSNRLATDTAGMSAVRSWICSGGRVWILLDLVDLETVRLLLGDACALEEVDRLTLTEGNIRDVTRPDGKVDHFEFPETVDFVRMIADGTTITHEIDGWPAAFWQPMGGGRIVFTTLGASAMVMDSPPLPPSQDGSPRPGRYEFSPTSTLSTVWNRLLDEGDVIPLEQPVIESMLFDEIGYRIPSRSKVAACLGLFCVGLLGVGLWLERRGVMERLLLAIPLVTVAAAAPLAWLGATSRDEVPRTVAAVQLVNVEPGQDDVHVSGLLALYNGESTITPLGANQGGLYLPDREALESDIWRMVWSDFDQWRLESATLPPGVRLAPFSFTQAGLNPISAVGTFGPDGFIGQLDSGPFTDAADLIVATDTHFTLPLRLTESGTFSSAPQDVLAIGQYISGRFLTDTQQTHQQVYRELFHVQNRVRKYPARPTLFAWTKPLDMSFQFADDVHKSGSALLTVPITLERPESGTKVVISAPFLPYRAVTGTGTAGLSTAYSNSTFTWQPRSSAGVSTLRVQIPTELLPLTPQQATLTIKANMPLRDVNILTGARDQLQPCAVEDGPVGVLKYELSKSESLQLDPDGGLHIALDIGDIKLERDEDYEHGTLDEDWRIDWIRLQLTGIID